MLSFISHFYILTLLKMDTLKQSSETLKVRHFLLVLFCTIHFLKEEYVFMKLFVFLNCGLIDE